MKLTWDPNAGFDGNGLGVAMSSTRRARLASRPELPFDFESIHYDAEAAIATKHVAGVESQLEAGELDAITTFLSKLP